MRTANGSLAGRMVGAVRRTIRRIAARANRVGPTCLSRSGLLQVIASGIMGPQGAVAGMPKASSGAFVPPPTEHLSPEISIGDRGAAVVP